MITQIKNLSEILSDQTPLSSEWKVSVVVNDDNMTYVVSNSATKEAIAVDPMKEDFESLLKVSKDLQGYRWLGVFDTHTHADHISVAANLADAVGAPLIMHHLAPSKKVHMRVSRDLTIQAQVPLQILLTPGHTQDSITILWGPFIFGGDTLMYGDTGRDDLPTGNPVEHFESLVKIKKHAKNEMILLPGHDSEGGRASSWATQLKMNTSLVQGREDFVRDAGSYVGPSPKLLKESLFENFK